MNLIKAETLGNVAFITLARPSARNALNLEMCRSLIQVLSGLSCRQDLVLIVLRGAGEAFCAGADLHEIKGKAQAEHLFQLLEDVMERVTCLPVPVLSVVNGPAIGAGLDLAAAADMRVSTTSAKFGVPALKLGLTPTRGLIERLSRIMGPAAAGWVLWSAKLFSPQEALQFGLVSEIWLPDELEQRLQAIIEDFGQRPAAMLHQTKLTIARCLKKISAETTGVN